MFDNWLQLSNQWLIIIGLWWALKILRYFSTSYKFCGIIHVIYLKHYLTMNCWSIMSWNYNLFWINVVEILTILWHCIFDITPMPVYDVILNIGSNNCRTVYCWCITRFQLMMPAYSSQEQALATKLVSVYPENAQFGLATHIAQILLFNPENGLLQAVSMVTGTDAHILVKLSLLKWFCSYNVCTFS